MIAAHGPILMLDAADGDGAIIRFFPRQGGAFDPDADEFRSSFSAAAYEL